MIRNFVEIPGGDYWVTLGDDYAELFDGRPIYDSDGRLKIDNAGVEVGGYPFVCFDVPAQNLTVTGKIKRILIELEDG